MDNAEDFAYEKWVLIILAIYLIATALDMRFLYSSLVNQLGASPDVTSHIMSEVTSLSFFNFAADAMFGALAGVYFYQRISQKGELS